MPYFAETDWNTFVSGNYHYFISTVRALDTAVYIGRDDDPDTVIIGGAGSEYVSGGGGDDVISTGDGRDVINGGDGNDRVFAGAGDDRVSTSDGSDELDGGSGFDTLALQDKAGAGWNVSLQSGLAYQALGPLLSPGVEINVAEITGFEAIIGSTEDDYIEGDNGDNILSDGRFFGRQDDDVILGFGGNDVIRIKGGSDEVDGGSGEDRIEVAGFNMDDHQLTGGADADVFAFDFFPRQTGKAATITDFDWREGDVIEIDGDYVKDYTSGSDPSLTGQASIWDGLINQTTTRLYVDHDGDRVADTWIDIDVDAGGPFLLSEDVILV